MVNFVFYCVIFLNVILVTKTWPSGNRSLNEYELTPNLKSICDDAKDYPYKKITEVISQTNDYSKFFRTLEGSIEELSSTLKPLGEETSESLCATITHTVYPKQMKNENNVERFIVNVEDCKQGLVFETCVKNAKCKYESSFPTTTTCTQKYARRKLIAVVDGNPLVDTFIVPSCCLCTITKNT